MQQKPASACPKCEVHEVGLHIICDADALPGTGVHELKQGAPALCTKLFDERRSQCGMQQMT
eukprot:6184153-Pleurochrysis_carterae.AAC.2